MYDEDAVTKIRAVEHVRYQMMPIWYTLFAEHAFNGAAIIRPLWYDYMSDVALYESEAQDREMLVGQDVLVVAADDPAKEPTVSVVLPAPGEARTALYVDDFATTAYTTGAYIYQELRMA